MTTNSLSELLVMKQPRCQVQGCRRNGSVHVTGTSSLGTKMAADICAKHLPAFTQKAEDHGWTVRVG